VNVNRHERDAYLHAMGIDVWVPRRPVDSLAAGPPRATVIELGRQTAPIAPVPPAAEVPLLDWDALKSQVAACTLCGLHATRTQTVFGVGSRTADWLFIGEAPGAEEDRQGEPFVGRAGQLLNNMLLAIGLRREQVYIANVLKCRPPKNRDPRPEEAQACEPYLKRQIDLLRPKVIVALGRIAAQNLLKTDTPIGKMRGRTYVYADTSIPLLVTYHPAYLLRSPAEKRKAWEDLMLAQKVVTAG
jgi:uracil-DNA glycosylase family 4